MINSYTTRVGAGPFPTEQLNQTGTQLQKIGGEIGVSTGRPRRCGWLDLVLLKYSTSINSYTSLNLTKLDVLDSFDTIRVGVAYILPSSGEIVTSFPADLTMLEACEVEYKDFEGWRASTSDVSSSSPTSTTTTTKGVRQWDQLPAKAREYVMFIEEAVGVPINTIGTGPDREDMIVR